MLYVPLRARFLLLIAAGLAEAARIATTWTSARTLSA